MPKNAIVLIVDGLGTGSLGPYGISSVDTEGFNRLASESIVADHAMIDAVDLNLIYRSMTRGGHAGYSHEWYDGRDSLPKAAAKSGVHTIWFSDHAAIAEVSVSSDFQRQIALSSQIPDANRLSDGVEQSWMATYFAEAIEAVSQMRDGSNLMWLHCPGMAVAWDAPMSFRCQFAGPDDPSPWPDAAPPELATDDPDERFRIECAYSGQVVLFDMLLSNFLQAIDSLPSEPLLIVAGGRSFPLGQHGKIGFDQAPLQPELVHVPMFARFPRLSSTQSLFENHVRLQSLIQPADIFSTLANWFDETKDIAEGQGFERCLTHPTGDERELAVTVGEYELSIRTPYWFACCYGPSSTESAACQLYLKPDDRWNLNDVADRCPHVVEDLSHFQADVRRALSDGQSLSDLDVPESLKTRVE
ncbi:MAG: hypothetical protein KDB27_24715 [Planctomycetales bacterium]|nr:hypothetical protein [Planctomycetales bacterium]